MSNEKAKTIEIVTREDEHLSRSGKLEAVTKSLDVDLLRERFADFMSKLQAIIDSRTAAVRSFQLEEVEFSAEISANGDFKLLGTGVGVEASTAIKFVLRRQPDSQLNPERS